MAKQNTAILYGFIEKKPVIINDRETGEPQMGTCYLHTVRSVRDAHDGKKYMKHDHPMLVTLEKHIMQEMETWQENDTIYIKGTVASKRVPKKCYCPECGTENRAKGLLLYVNPIFARRVHSFPDKDGAQTEIIKCREISNQAIIFGELCNDPSFFKTKRGLVVTQYQLETPRKYRIKSDDPENRTDWPWVKSYGDQALNDKMRLRKGALVLIDGTLQARTVNRKTKCEQCGTIFPWQDHTMEIVPFDTEYLAGYKTDEMIKEEKGQESEEILQQLFNSLDKVKDVEEDMHTDDLEDPDSTEE